MNFNDMLNYLFKQMQHLNIMKEIDDKDINLSNYKRIEKDLENFDKLFHFNSLPESLKFFSEE